MSEEGESQPLLAQYGKTSLRHTESIYSAALFQSALSRKHHGHFWTTENFTIFALLILNVAMQVLMTTVAGHAIEAKQYDFKDSLTGGAVYHSPYLELVEQAQGNLDHFKNEASKLAGIEVDEEGNECCNGASCATLGFPCCDREGTYDKRSSWEDMKARVPRTPMRPFSQRVNESEGRLKNESQDLANAERRLETKIRDTASEDRQSTAAMFLAVQKPGGKRSKKGKKEAGGGRMGPQHSICTANKSNFWFCNPISYSYIDRWDDLDTNQDGEWSLDEARADEANVGCQLGISAEDVFRSSCRGVLRDVHDTLIHRHMDYSYMVPVSLSQYEAVPKAYFEWWTGIAMLCVNFSPDRCSQLLSRGYFDYAIGSGKRWTKGGIDDLDSALDYCQRMLEPGGLCEQALPGYYVTHRKRVQELCGGPVYVPSKRYINPHNPRDAMRTIDVGFKVLNHYTEHTTWRFRFFLCMILLIWYVNLLDEFQELLKCMDFLKHFPVDDANPWLHPHFEKMGWLPFVGGSGAQGESGSDIVSGEDKISQDPSEKHYHHTSTGRDIDDDLFVESIAWPHWLLFFVIVVIRMCLLVYLFHAGTTFLLTDDQGYADLLLNAVALSFIFDLPVLLYYTIFPDVSKKALEGACTAEWETGLPKKGILSLVLNKTFWGLLVLPVLVFWVVSLNYWDSTIPILEALQCTCVQEGPRCEVATRSTREWWNNYWQNIHQLFSVNSGNYHRLN